MEEQDRKKAGKPIRTATKSPEKVDRGAVSPDFVKPALLLVDKKELVFPTTKQGDYTDQSIAIAQHYADTPVTLSTDQPAAFQLAIGTKDVFAPSQTIGLSTADTTVYIRFLPNRAGKQMARLLIQTPYTTKTVALTGLSPAPLTVNWRKLALISVILGLLVVGFQNRCRISPMFCPDMQLVSQDEPATDSTLGANPVMTPPLVDTVANETITPVVGSLTRSSSETVVALDSTPTTKDSSFLLTKRMSVRSKPPIGLVPIAESDLTTPKNQTTSTLSRRPEPAIKPRQRAQQPVTEESELERELNRKPGN